MNNLQKYMSGSGEKVMKHKVELVKDLMYKGCELHWHCVHCDDYIPVHCYSKEELENMECKGNKKQ